MSAKSPKILIILLLFIAFAARAQTPGPRVEVPAPAPARTAAYPIHGMIGLSYLHRDVENAYDDNDIYTYVSVDFGTPGQSRISGHLFGRMSADLDNDVEEEPDQFQYFRDITDYYGDPVNFRLYSAYLDVNRLGPIKLIRLGRQEMWDAPVFLYYDGARIETAEAKKALSFKLGAYGGVPVRHLYESSNAGDETVYGAYAQTRPWQGARATVHWTHLEDKNYYEDLKEDYLAFGLRQSIKDQLQLEAFYSRLDDEDRDLRGRILLYIPQTQTQIQVAYYELLEPQTYHTLELDYYYWVMQTYLPYRQINVSAYQGITKYFGIQGGYDTRELTEDNEESPWNHEFIHYFVSLILRPADSLSISASSERWLSNNGDLDLTSAAGDITYRLDRKFRASVGTYYSLYTYDILLEEEEERVQTYYVKLGWAPWKFLMLDAAYEYEETEYEDFNTARVGINYIF